MKAVVTILVAILLMAATAHAADPNEGLALWGLSADNADSLMEFRIGWEYERIEPGIGLKWFTGNPQWGPEPDAIAGYVAYHVNEFIVIDDPEPDNLLEEFLHQFTARPYTLIEWALPIQGEGRQIRTNFAVGTSFSNDPQFKWAFVTEYIVGDGVVTAEDDWAVKLGVRWRF